MTIDKIILLVKCVTYITIRVINSTIMHTVINFPLKKILGGFLIVVLDSVSYVVILALFYLV